MRLIGFCGNFFDLGASDPRASLRRVWTSCIAFLLAIACCFLWDHRPANAQASADHGRVQTTLASGMSLLLIFAMLATMTGCTPAQKMTAQQVVTAINAKMPTVIAAADTVSATVEMLDPASAALIMVGDAGFDAVAQTIYALTKSYLAYPQASTLAQITAAINGLEVQLNTATLNAVGIKDEQSQRLALAALKGLLTLVTVIFGLVEQTQTVAQLRDLADRNQIHLARLRPLMDGAILQQAASDHGITVDQFFAAQARLGLA